MLGHLITLRLLKVLQREGELVGTLRCPPASGVSGGGAVTPLVSHLQISYKPLMNISKLNVQE